MPGLMMTIFGLQADSYHVRLVKKFEKWSIRFANAVLTPNEAFRKLFLTRGCPPQKISVIMNSPDESIFRYHESSGYSSPGCNVSKRFVIMYHGSLVERHGLDLAVAALGKVRESMPGAELRIYGQSTPFLEQVMDSVQKSNLDGAVRYFGTVKLEQIPAAIRQCDIGVVPNRPSVFTKLNLPTRLFEYLSQGKPVIAPRTPGILDYFGSRELLLFELGSIDDLAAKMEYAFAHPEELAQMVKCGQEVCRTYSWSGERRRLIWVVKQLLTKRLDNSP
jgi:glycosyltransferase involved in cell wall biosynthesis